MDKNPHAETSKSHANNPHQQPTPAPHTNNPHQRPHRQQPTGTKPRQPPVGMNIDCNVELHIGGDPHAKTSESHASIPHHQPTPTPTDPPPPTGSSTDWGTQTPPQFHRGSLLCKGNPLHEGSPHYEYPREHPYGRVPKGESL